MTGFYEWRAMVARALFGPVEHPEIDEEQARINTAPLTNEAGERERLITVMAQPRKD